MPFEIIGRIEEVETIASGRSIRQLRRLQKMYGSGRWLKRKGVAKVKLEDGTIGTAEVHWYEADGIGRRELKIKRKLANNG